MLKSTHRRGPELALGTAGGAPWTRAKVRVSQRVGTPANGPVAWYSRSAMSAIRLPLLCAFAGGCLSNALLFGLWRTADGAGASSAKQQHRSQNVELMTTTTVAPGVAHPSELVAATAAEHGHDAATEAAPTPAASDLDSAGPTPAGSAVSDVLMQLEAAYRARDAARAPAQSSPTQEHVSAAAPVDNAVAAAESAREVSAQPVAEVVPAIPAVTVAAAITPAAVAPAAVAPQVAAVPAVAAQDAPLPSAIHYGDVNQNTYITNVRQGDVYLIQVQQQLAMLQYMQLLGMSSGLAAPARHVGGIGHQRAAFPSGITNPDNPWGFHFAPPNLVR